MFELFTGSKEDAIAIIRDDHTKVKRLFEDFENTDSLAEKKKIAAKAIEELKIHAEIEEKIFYPTVRANVEEDLMNEADEEHHVAKLLIAELDNMTGKEDHWEAKFTVLAENIRHHIKEEENEMLPQARKADVDFNRLGQKLLVMKQLLKKTGVPESDEAKLMKRGLVDSPAKAAKKKPSRSASVRKPSQKRPAMKMAAKRKGTTPAKRRTAK